MSNISLEFEGSAEFDLFSSAFGCSVLERYQIVQLIHFSEDSTIYKMKRYHDGVDFTLKALKKYKNIHMDLDRTDDLSRMGLEDIVEHGESNMFLYVVKPYRHVMYNK